MNSSSLAKIIAASTLIGCAPLPEKQASDSSATEGSVPAASNCYVITYAHRNQVLQDTIYGNMAETRTSKGFFSVRESGVLTYRRRKGERIHYVRDWQLVAPCDTDSTVGSLDQLAKDTVTK